MANAAAKEQENQDKSMEDVLQSIRAIIAENETSATKPASAQEENFGSDVLELTDLAEEPSPAGHAAEAGGIDIMAEIAQATAPAPAAVEEPAAFAPPYVPPAAHAPEPSLSPQPLDRLISEQTAYVSAASMKRVIETHKATTPMPHLRSGTTIEDLVLETLRPLLKDWLDANLPTMVERIVEREIRKLVE